MSSSSDSEPDENTKMLMASVDTSFLSDNFYKNTGEKVSKPEPKQELPKSNRYLDDNADVLWKSDINISESMQKYCGQKFSEMVSKTIEFVEVEPPAEKKSSKNEEIIGVRLFSGAPFIDLNKDPNPDLPKMLNKPLVIKKRSLEENFLSEETKIKEAKIESDDILSKSSTKHWKSRQKPKLYEYKTKKGVSYLREPVTEFTDLRNKNNWSEAKIKETHDKKFSNKKNHN